MASAAIIAGAMAAAGACQAPPPHSTLTSRVDAGLCRAGGLDGGAADDGGSEDAGACTAVDAAADDTPDDATPDHQ
jgi:hypothetical protein